MAKYYHYTNRDGASAIQACGYINPSGPSGAFGPGVYVNDMDPRIFTPDNILKNNYGGVEGGIRPGYESRAEFVFEITAMTINFPALVKINVPGERNRSIFVYPYPIPVRPNRMYRNPRYEEFLSQPHNLFLYLKSLLDFEPTPIAIQLENNGYKAHRENKHFSLLFMLSEKLQK